MELFVSDLDGTLLNQHQTLDKNTIFAINNIISEKGINFTIATARSHTSTWPLIKELDLRLPMILHNGALVYCPVNKVNLLENMIHGDITDQIIQAITSSGLNPFVFTFDADTGNKVYYRGIFNFGEDDYIGTRLRSNDRRLTITSDFSETSGKKIITINIIDTEEKIIRIHNKLKKQFDLYYHLTRDIYSGFFWLEITNLQANKRDSLIFLKKHLNAERIICFGDNLNDLPMFEVSDESYAVANAHENLKKTATGIIGSNTDNGVAEFILRRFLKAE